MCSAKFSGGVGRRGIGRPPSVVRAAAWPLSPILSRSQRRRTVARWSVDNRRKGRTVTQAFNELQSRLAPIWTLNKAGVGIDHVLVVLPSISVAESLLSHYAPRIP